MTPKLSIGVPIYNVEQYLRKCVDSLLNQDLSSSDYEIILVDDGATDSCPAICDEYAAKYDNIRVVHQKNAGLSAARNSMIPLAQGRYIMFVDSDDFLEPNVLGELVRTMDKKQLDILRFNYQNVRAADGVQCKVYGVKYEVFEPFKNFRPYVDYGEDVLSGEVFLNKKLGYACYAWQFIMRTELVQRDGNMFKPGIYFEDTEWTPRVMIQAKRVSSTSLVVYNYFWRVGSISLSVAPEKKRKVIEDKIKLLYGFKEQRKLVSNPQWFVWLTSVMTMSILGLLTELSVMERKPYIDEIKSIGVFPLTTYRANRNSKIKIRLANISPYIYCRVMSLLRKR